MNRLWSLVPAGRVVSALVAVAVLGLPGCRDSGTTPPAAGTTAPAASTVQDVRFNAGGGITLAGRLYGRSAVNGVLLAPDVGRGIDVWDALARDLAASGLIVLAYDYPGQGASARVTVPVPSEALVRAGASFLRARGAEKVALVGEGGAGAASLTVGARDRAVAVAAISSDDQAAGPPDGAEVIGAAAGIDGPVLFMGALGDGRQAAAARRLYDAARDPRTLALVPGSGRGADILKGEGGAAARDVLRDFLRTAFAPQSA
jgi:hypothetical protein